MKVHLTFVPPGGGESDYEIVFEMPAVPQPGDYVRINRPSNAGMTEDFIVRRTWWVMEMDDKATSGGTKAIVVECEFAISPMSSDNHKRAVEMYKSRGQVAKEFDDSAF